MANLLDSRNLRRKRQGQKAGCTDLDPIRAAISHDIEHKYQRWTIQNMEAITINNLVAMVASIMALLGNRNRLEIVLDAVFQCTTILLLVADGQVRQDVPRFNLTVIHMNSRHALLGTASIQRCQIRLFLSRTSGRITKDFETVISKNNRRRIIEQSNLEIGDLWRNVLYKRISK